MGETERAEQIRPSAKPVGDRLRDARVAEGMDIAEIADRTRIPQRHLEAIETSDYSSLPSPTYAMGFARSYARIVGVDEVAMARDLRAELDTSYEREPPHIPYDTSEPAKLPTGGIALAGVVVAVLVLIGAGIWFGTGIFRSDDPAPATIVASQPSAPARQPAAAPAPAVPTSGGQVSLTATDDVWVRVYNADNDTLFMKTMQAGERYDVPGGADGPMINVGRPDKLEVRLNGSVVAPLGPPERAVKDVGVSADALRARDAAGGSTSPAPAA